MTARILFRALATAVFMLGSSQAFTQSAKTYQYDARGRLVKTTDGVGSKTDYTYDKADNRSNVAAQTQFPTAWEAEALPHQIGYTAGNGWAADVTLSAGFMTYGPYSGTVPVGARVATWRALVDNAIDANNGNVVTLDVYDATAGQQLASRTLTRHSWVANWAYQVFELPFTMDASRAGHAIELRTFYHGSAYARVDRIGYY